uniref:Uncharacterized protein n=1 Tax=Timema monikensis TaxID=170555 RepID=A0A7R9EFG5_9NEOP|nr:unnamed protein product [Timema monikensis]
MNSSSIDFINKEEHKKKTMDLEGPANFETAISFTGLFTKLSISPNSNSNPLTRTLRQAFYFSQLQSPHQDSSPSFLFLPTPIPSPGLFAKLPISTNSSSAPLITTLHQASYSPFPITLPSLTTTLHRALLPHSSSLNCPLH